jgi:hypothetical protein
MELSSKRRLKERRGEEGKREEKKLGHREI